MRVHMSVPACLLAHKVTHKGSYACLWPENSDGETGVHLGHRCHTQ